MTWEAQSKCRHYPNCMIHTGEEKPSYGLSIDNVQEIRELLSHGESAVAIAREFGIGQNVVLNIKHRKTYNRIGD